MMRETRTTKKEMERLIEQYLDDKFKAAQMLTVLSSKISNKLHRATVLQIANFLVRATETPLPKTPVLDPKLFLCKDCGTAFASKDELDSHKGYAASQTTTQTK